MIPNPFKRPTPLERGRELAEKHPEEFKTIYTEDFIGATNWTDTARYLGFFIAHEISFKPITKRRQIEDFTYYPLLELGKGDEHIAKGGDFDHINEPKKYDFIGGEERRKAYLTAIKNGATVRAIMEKEGILPGGQTYLNALVLAEMGVKVRCLDDSLHAAVTTKGSKRSACVWEGVLTDSNYVRREGFYQTPGKMRYEGYILNDYSEEHEPFIKSLVSHLNELWEKATPVEEVLVKVNTKKFRPILPNILSLL